MPATEVQLYSTGSGTPPVVEWLETLARRAPKAYAKCVALILELEERGYEMRRPHMGILRDGIYELRATGTPYRILFFLRGKNAVVLSHGIQKEKRVPPHDIEVAIPRRKHVEESPGRHIAEFELPEE